MIDKLRIKDLIILKNLGSTHSIRELARQMSLDPQNLTKRIAFIEKTLGSSIMDRSVTGFTLNEFGRSVISTSAEITGLLTTLTEAEAPEKTLRFCSRGYLVDYFIDYVMPAFEQKHPSRLFELMDSSPELMERVARKGQLDIILSFNDVILGENFIKKEVGVMPWAFFTHPDHELHKTRGEVSDFQGAPVLGFCYFDSDRVSSRNSPHIKNLNGTHGHHIQSSRYATKVIRQSNAIGYMPRLAAREEVESGQVEELNVPAKYIEERKVFLHANIDKLTNKELSSLEKTLVKAITGA